MIFVRKFGAAPGPSALVRYAPVAFLITGSLLVFITLLLPKDFCTIERGRGAGHRFRMNQGSAS